MAQHSVVSVTTRQKKLIDELVRSGRFQGAQDVIDAGLRLLEDREREAAAFVANLEEEVNKGLVSGPAIDMEGAEALLARFRRQRT